jgi:hypothetical protein
MLRHSLLYTETTGISSFFLSKTKKITLVQGLVRDEGPLRAARFVFNVLCHQEARKRVLELRHLFRSYRDNVAAVAMIGVKR